MKLSNKSKHQAEIVLSMIKERRITTIHTRGALDRMIEIIKFPETASLQTWSSFPGLPGRCLKSGKVTAYKNQQYDPIRNYLIESGHLEQSHDGYRYHYKVNY